MTRTERRNARRAARARVGIATCATLLLVLAALLGCRIAEPDTSATEAAAPPAASAVTNVRRADTPAAHRPAQEAGAAEVLAKMVWGEARGCSTTEQAAAIWCALNRVDSMDPYFPDDIVGVVTQSGAFYGYDQDNPVTPELLALAKDVISRWSIEDNCLGDVGRVLPAEYLYFSGDGRHNYFRTDYIGGDTWDWSLESPYQES